MAKAALDQGPLLQQADAAEVIPSPLPCTQTCTNPETRPSYHSLTKQSFFTVRSDTHLALNLSFVRDISLLRGFHSAAPCYSPIDMNFFVYQGDAPLCKCAIRCGIRYVLRAVLFLETMATTTFCRLRPELLHRHGCHCNFDCFQQQVRLLML